MTEQFQKAWVHFAEREPGLGYMEPHQQMWIRDVFFDGARAMLRMVCASEDDETVAQLIHEMGLSDEFAVNADDARDTKDG